MRNNKNIQSSIQDFSFIMRNSEKISGMRTKQPTPFLSFRSFQFASFCLQSSRLDRKSEWPAKAKSSAQQNNNL